LGPKRILMVGEVDFSKDDAPKVHFLNLAINFNKLGWRTKAIVYSPEKKILEEERKLINMNFLPNPLIGNKLGRIVKYLLIVPFIIVEIFSFKPQIIYFRFSPPAFLYLLVIKLCRFFSFDYKVIVEFNDWVSEQRRIQGESELKAKIIEFLQLKSVLFVDYVRVVTLGIKRKLGSFGINCNKIVVIGNGTDINHFKPIDKTEAKEKLGFAPDLLYVGFIGNFAVWQGLTHLLRAIPKVLKVHNDVRFLLVGDGTEMPKIRGKVAKLETEKIILTGRVPYQDANLYINALDIGVAPFIRERNESIGLSPLKIYEYAACGIPIITTKIRGLGMIKEKGIGILVPPDNPEALSDAIIKLIKDPALRNKMGKKGREVAEKEFSWKNVVLQILNYIKE